MPTDPELATAGRHAVERRSDAIGLRHLAGHLVLLAATGTALVVTWGSWWTPALLVAHGVLLVFLFCPLHESGHRTAFRTRWINVVVGYGVGAILLLPSRWFRLFHAAHHRWTQDPAHDPELTGPQLPVALRLTGLPYWWSELRALARLAAGRAEDPFIPPGHRRAVVREVRVLVAVYAVVAAVSVLVGSWLAVQLWLLPALVGQPFLRAFLLAEHTGCPQVPDMAANTRTTLTNPVMRALCWNMSFHAEHHARPGVPFHHLPALHTATATDLQVIGHGYVRTVARIASRARCP